MNASLVLAAIDEGRRAPNNAAGIAGFALLVLWLAVIGFLVWRTARRRSNRIDVLSEGTRSQPVIDASAHAGPVQQENEDPDPPEATP